MPRRAKIYAAAVIAAGFGLLAVSLAQGWHVADRRRYICYLALTALASALKLRLPNIHGTMSINFLFILIGIATLTLSETLLLAAMSGFIQCVWWPKRRASLLQVLFNMAVLVISSTAAYGIAHSLGVAANLPAPLALSAVVYFVLNSGFVSVILSLIDGRPLTEVLRLCHFLALPYYLVGALVAGVASTSSPAVGWRVSLATLSVMTLVYHYFKVFIAQRPEPAVVKTAD